MKSNSEYLLRIESHWVAVFRGLRCVWNVECKRHLVNTNLKELLSQEHNEFLLKSLLFQIVYLIFSEGETLEIGSVVHTTLNGEVKSGMLLCSSGMGLTVLDLFNDIFIDQNDIRFFIEQHGLTPSTSSSGTIIQAYLIFCHMAAENNNMPIFDLIKRN